MHYMAEAWLHKMQALESEVDAAMQTGAFKAFFAPEYHEDFKKRYRHATEQFRYWQVQA